ncbi:MAG: hypothetical protein M5U27_05805 [Gaiella sp.]|nr:hypothetical protein [Gaiella sp.]
MQVTGTSATARLAGTSADVAERPDAATVTLERDEIEEALSSDMPLELILSVKPGADEPRDISVAWQREDLETVLAGAGAGPVTFAFDRAELHRALEHPDFEAHGMRELVLLVAVGASSAALMAATASGQVPDAGGGGAIGAVMDAGGGSAIGTAMDAGGGGAIGTAMDASGGGTIGTAMDASGGGTIGTAMDASGGGTIGTAMDASGGGAIGTAMDASGGGTIGAAAVPGHGEAATAREVRAAGAAVPGHGEAATAGSLAASAAIHDETGSAARGIGLTRPGNDEATLVERGIDPAIATALGSGDATTARDLAAPAAPAPGSSLDLPSVDAGTAAVVGGLAGAGLLIIGGAFAVRRQRVTPA